jgi:acetone carboxylase gamma subunit
MADNPFRCRCIVIPIPDKMFILTGLDTDVERVISCECYFDLVRHGKRKIFPLEVKEITRMTLFEAVDVGWRRDVIGWKCPDCSQREE